MNHYYPWLTIEQLLQRSNIRSNKKRLGISCHVAPCNTCRRDHWLTGWRVNSEAVNSASLVAKHSHWRCDVTFMALHLQRILWAPPCWSRHIANFVKPGMWQRRFGWSWVVPYDDVARRKRRVGSEEPKENDCKKCTKIAQPPLERRTHPRHTWSDLPNCLLSGSNWDSNALSRLMLPAITILAAPAKIEATVIETPSLSWWRGRPSRWPHRLRWTQGLVPLTNCKWIIYLYYSFIWFIRK